MGNSLNRLQQGVALVMLMANRSGITRAAAISPQTPNVIISTNAPWTMAGARLEPLVLILEEMKVTDSVVAAPAELMEMGTGKRCVQVVQLESTQFTVHRIPLLHALLAPRLVVQGKVRVILARLLNEQKIVSARTAQQGHTMMEHF